jgi:hypothetical protein
MRKRSSADFGKSHAQHLHHTCTLLFQLWLMVPVSWQQQTWPQVAEEQAQHAPAQAKPHKPDPHAESNNEPEKSFVCPQHQTLKQNQVSASGA